MSTLDPGAPAREAEYPPGLVAGLGTKHLPILDGLRALAALAVVAYHFDEVHFPIGGYGVLTFFVLSGFLITWLMCAEAERTGRISLRRFYARRSLRIFPAFYVYWGIVTALLVAWNLTGGKAVPWMQAIASFFYLSNYYQGLNDYPSSAYSHTWSLGVEEQFYLLWPALFIALVGLAPRRRAIVIGVLVVFFWGVRNTLHFAGAPAAYMYTSFETRCDQLLIGCLLAVTLRAGLAGSFVRFVTKIPGVVTFALFCGSVYLSVTIGNNYRNTIGFCIEPALVGLLIVQLIAKHDHPLVRWLDSRPMKFLGGASYSIYLYQQIVVYPMLRVLPAGLPAVVKLPLVVGAVVAVAYGSFRFVEAPFIRIKSRFAA
ncbi:MAG: acyltransferase [Gemmatimonadales bacterium]